MIYSGTKVTLLIVCLPWRQIWFYQFN